MPVFDCFYFSFWLSLITELTEISNSFLSPGTIIHSTPFRTIGKPILIYISHLFLGLSSVSSFFRFLKQTLPLHVTCSAHHILLDLSPNHVGRGLGVTKFRIMQFSSSPVTYCSSNIFLNVSFSNTLSLRSSHNARDHALFESWPGHRLY